MSVLSKSERDGLEDVFLSIHTSHDKFNVFKEVSTLLISPKKYLSVTKLVKHAKYGIKKKKLSHYLGFLLKKKKNLSK